ncbi:hypothetical protein [Streptococcus agalactiae]|uniref:hypothetical protein n=1 Tax=Streptococcus agalactiae TaxID=1311 RepID=UPI00085C1B67|nr:hypothetical protein [Streptococcus agalactiae]
MKQKQKGGCLSFIITLVILFFVASLFIRGNDSKKETTETTQKTSTTKETTKATTSSSIKETETLERYAKNSNYLGEYEYNAEYDVYIISGNITSSLGDKIAIESFNDTIYDAIHKGFKTDKPVIFRAWDSQQDEIITGALIYFSIDNFNRDWSETNFDSTKTYQFSDGWQTTSKFGQYLSSVHKANDEKIEEQLFNLFMLNKE